ncbi:MAG: 16S rRNA (cytosine(1402)-N(4))-methyltransferase, partial [Rhodothermales bacterium]|nr:16S rRNA (cytosine(1402)-N(4))-methyltransferase [Rhodothermales bacterium]
MMTPFAMPKPPSRRPEGAPPAPYATPYHAPVLYREVVEGLVTDPAGVYVDGTLGGGGHAAALLDALGPEGQVVGIDQDPEALAAVRERLEPAVTAGRLVLLRGNFGDLEALLTGAGLDAVDGVLLDLGVSSDQLDTPARGFRFAPDTADETPLD